MSEYRTGLFNVLDSIPSNTQYGKLTMLLLEYHEKIKYIYEELAFVLEEAFGYQHHVTYHDSFADFDSGSTTYRISDITGSSCKINGTDSGYVEYYEDLISIQYLGETLCFLRKDKLK